MSIHDALLAQVKKTIEVERWNDPEGRCIPSTEDISLGNHGKRILATILYADLADSTELVDNHSDKFAAEIYKSYLHCAVKIIRNNEGNIASFDGDRVMGVFYGDRKNTNAVKSALQINGAVINIINPTLANHYTNKSYRVIAACGIDSSQILVARTGIRNNNDLVWVGRAANHAAKLCNLREGTYSTWITKAVYDAMHESVKISKGENMWEARTWTKYTKTVYRSSWWYRP